LRTPARARTLHRTKSTIFVRKSEQFLRSAELAAERGDWDAAVSSAVHAAISIADALTVFYLGERSASQDHRYVLRLLETIRSEPTELLKNKRHLSSLLATKDAAEYGERLLNEADAVAALEHCMRFCRWANSKLPS